jgi:hypothetical protein
VLRAALAALAVTATGCLVPLGIPSARIDGGYTPQGAGALRAGTHVVGYRHDESARWDLGAGYSLTTATFDPMVTHASGVYLEGSYLHRLDDHARLSLGPGLNLMFRGSAEELVPELYVRAGVEFFAPVHAAVSSSDRCGVAAGTWFGQAAFGAYVDVEKPLGESGVAAVIGLSGRLPAFGGAALVIPYCK